MNNSLKVLILVKKRQLGSYNHGASGLYYSAQFVVELLKSFGHEVNFETCVDGNEVDKFLAKYKPNICILEAYWVTPDKIKENQKLHPKVQFIVRNHSKPSFLAHEGMAIQWTLAYLKQGVIVASNNKESSDAFRTIAQENKVPTNNIVYLPNYYKAPYEQFGTSRTKLKTLNIGCFGAIRPFKNQVNQALAAIKASQILGLKLNFHINSERVEGNADGILKSLRSVFQNNVCSTLVEHEWLDHKNFLLLLPQMDVSMQVSYSETFNLVSSDAVQMNVPIIVSPEINWIKNCSQIADPNNVNDMVNKLLNILTAGNWRYERLLNNQKKDLKKYLDASSNIWNEYLKRFSE